MDFSCEERASDSPYIEKIWRRQSDEVGGSFLSIAKIHSSMVVTKTRQRIVLTVRGPETRATPATAPANAEFLCILFKPGAYMPNLPPKIVIDRRDLNLPEASSGAFWLNGSAWQYPDFENADTFVDWLARNDLLVYDPLVNAILEKKPVDTSLRTMQRHFLQATGLTLNAAHQIERARFATACLKRGASILDTVDDAGYYDQPHLTRSLRYFIGLTPAQISDRERSERLSLLYKTEPLH